MCATMMIAKPRYFSAAHHRGEQDIIIYTASGKGLLVTNTDGGKDQLQQDELSAGDFALVPPGTEHQETNETNDAVVCILIRSGLEPVIVNLTYWDGDRARTNQANKWNV
ncbi:hypothetical protein GGS21DRAFT_488533 [Xylaria nigripes]|nr:hypothetical protein GGS21DRAFT_488533 [Xylaria nigripes]